MNPRLPFRVFIPASVLGIAALALAFDGTAPASRTGAPAIGGKAAEQTCAGCHGDFGINLGGSVQILGAPAYYTPGNVYNFAVQVTSSQTAGSAFSILWGFELTAVRMSDGNGAGTFANVAGQGTATVFGGAQFATRQYVRVSTNDQAGIASPVTWQVQWTAPAAGTGDVTFYASGLAADGDGSTGGDWVYTTSALTQDVTPATNPTWGGVKRRYR